MANVPTPQQVELGKTGEILGAGVGVLGSTLSLSGVALTAGTGLTAAGLGVATLGIGAGVVIIASLVFHGADPNQVPAAKINQACIGAADKLSMAHGKGMISRQQAIDGMDWLKQEANVLMQQYPQLGNSTNSKIQDTIPTIDRVIDAEKSSSEMMKVDNVTVEIDPSKTKGWYPTVGASGWYSDAVQAADALADKYLSSLPKNFPTTAQAGSQVISDITSGKLSNLATDITKSSVFTWATIALVALGIWGIVHHG